MGDTNGTDGEPYRIADGVYGVTLDEARTLSGYVVDDDEPAVVEPGTADGVDRLLGALDALGVDASDVRHIVVSHYHLDHSGGARPLLDRAPAANVYVHGAMSKWVTDPERYRSLVDSTADSLGPQFEDMGAPEDPLPTDRVTLVEDGDRLDLGALSLELLHTPGHSPDHLSALVPERDVLFANEAVGRYFPEADAFHPPATLPSFDIEATTASIDRLASVECDTVAFSHVGTRDDPERVFDRARWELDRFRRTVTDWYDETGDLDATIDHVRSDLLGLDPAYPDHVAAVQARVCTVGFLAATDRLS